VYIKKWNVFYTRQEILKCNNRVNVIKTVYFNLRTLPLKQALKIPILLYGKTEILSSQGTVEIIGGIHYGVLRLGIMDPTRSYGAISTISLKGLLRVSSGTVLRQGIRLQIGMNAIVTLKENVYIGDNNTIISEKNITIGENTRVANNVVFMDTDIHYIINVQNGEVKDNKGSIEIGAGNWIGSWSTIKKNTKTPNYVIVSGPYSMLSKDYSKIVNEYSIIGGCPAKLITEGFRRINNEKSERLLSEHYLRGDNIFTLQESVGVDYFCVPNNTF
jgi:acetyltransferase-like isoleucine patch superfamily enzyme